MRAGNRHNREALREGRILPEILGIALVVLLLAASTFGLVHSAQERLRHEELQRLASEIQLGIERYAVDNVGDYPADIAELTARGYITQWPSNPFGGGPLRVILPGATPAPGDLIYVRFDPPPAEVVPAELSDGYELCREMPHYVLLAHGRRSHRVAAQALADYRASGGADDRAHVDAAALGLLNQFEILTLLGSSVHDRIHWEKVEVILTSGPDYFVGCR